MYLELERLWPPNSSCLQTLSWENGGMQTLLMPFQDLFCGDFDVGNPLVAVESIFFLLLDERREHGAWLPHRLQSQGLGKGSLLRILRPRSSPWPVEVHNFWLESSWPRFHLCFLSTCFCTYKEGSQDKQTNKDSSLHDCYSRGIHVVKGKLV